MKWIWKTTSIYHISVDGDAACADGDACANVCTDGDVGADACADCDVESDLGVHRST